MSLGSGILGSGIQDLGSGDWDPGIQGFRDPGIQGSRDSGIQGYRDPEISDSRMIGSRGSGSVRLAKARSGSVGLGRTGGSCRAA